MGMTSSMHVHAMRFRQGMQNKYILQIFLSFTLPKTDCNLNGEQ
jgi:hypothetical protein